MHYTAAYVREMDRSIRRFLGGPLHHPTHLTLGRSPSQRGGHEPGATLRMSDQQKDPEHAETDALHHLADAEVTERKADEGAY